MKALRDLDAGVHWALAGAKGEMTAGNGAAMRIAPLAFHLDPEKTHDRQLLRDVCRITHHNDEAYVGALSIVLAIRSVVFEESSTIDLIQSVLLRLPDSRVRDRLVELSALNGDQRISTVAQRFGSSGYVVDSVPLGLYATQHIGHIKFEEVLRYVIEAGGDTDTIASMTGQIAGAWLGASQISRELIQLLPNAAYIEQVADRFAATLKTGTGA